MNFPNDLGVGGTYTGQLLLGMRHGHGTMIWNDGDVYEGEWVNNHQSGHGLWIWADGKRYEGNFTEGSIDGRGLFAFNDGRVFQGEFRDTCMQSGMVVETDGTAYRAEFDNGARAWDWPRPSSKVRIGAFERWRSEFDPAGQVTPPALRPSQPSIT